MRTFHVTCSYMSKIFVLFHTETMSMYIMSFRVCSMLWVCVMYQLCISMFCSHFSSNSFGQRIDPIDRFSRRAPKKERSRMLVFLRWIFRSGHHRGACSTHQVERARLVNLMRLGLISAWAAAHSADLQVSRSPVLPVSRFGSIFRVGQTLQVRENLQHRRRSRKRVGVEDEMKR